MSDAGAKVIYGPTMFNSHPTLEAPATASTAYAPRCDARAHRPSVVLADVEYHFRMVDDTGTERWNTLTSGLVVTTGLNQLISAGLLAAPWYCFLVDGSTTPVIASSDTMAVHPGWAEESADYSQAARPTITFGTPAVNGSLDNSGAQAQFSFTSTGVIAGAGVCSANTKGVDSGTLYDVGLFPAPIGYLNYSNGWNLYLAITCSVAAA